jgi:dihydrofolate synthase/folylpolyglutamate synthase
LPTTLAEWLIYIEQTHPKSIELGLDRVNQVKIKLGLTPDFPLIIVAGTNGKGSVCAMLEAILSCAGYQVGCYTSPHLLHYNERTRINQQAVADTALCQALEAVELARINSDTSLTYFEYGTLAAMHLFIAAKVEIVILEVGLGGRLDAVNVFDADCAIITSISLDHMDYLGNTREAIGFEKAGIFRKGKIAICAESDAPSILHQQAKLIGANFQQIATDFGYIAEKTQWRFWSHRGGRHSLPYPTLRGNKQLQNATACLLALDSLKENLPVNMNDIRQGLLNVSLPGRFQVIPGQPLVVLDVAHNPAAARVLAENLDAMDFYSQTYVVFAMLKDKDIAGVIQALKHCVDIWLISPIESERSAQTDALLEMLNASGIEKSMIHIFPDPVASYVFACKHATKNDRICVMGSFLTVNAVLQQQARIQ